MIQITSVGSQDWYALKRERDELVQHLRWACTVLGKNDLFYLAPSGLLAWWATEKEKIEIEEAAQRKVEYEATLREKAMSKLSAEEIRVLGLDKESQQRLQQQMITGPNYLDSCFHVPCGAIGIATHDCSGGGIMSAQIKQYCRLGSG